MGGVATLIKSEDAESSLKVMNGVDGNEFLITRHSQFKVPINIINIYGDVESRTSTEVIENKWNAILKEIIKIETREESILIIGDLNKHLGTKIKGNHSKITFGGKLVINLLESDKYTLVNGSEKAKGGVFTRYDPGDPNNNGKKSSIDLAIVSNNLFGYVDTFHNSEF